MLSGDIRVNTHTVGRWTAIKVEPCEQSMYLCNAVWETKDVRREPKGLYPFDMTTVIYHREEEGAVSLAAKVLNAAVQKINEREDQS